MMRAAFLGTPSAAVVSLAALINVADVPLVITRSDKARGRSGHPMPSTVKLAAQDWGLTVVQPETPDELLGAFAGLDLDVAVVVAYGRILRPDVLATTRVGFVNLHFSLLPRWRGAAPVERAILAGDTATGCTLMKLDEGIDTGPVIAALETPIEADETGGSLTGRLAYLGGLLLNDALPAFMAGGLRPAAQLQAGATNAARLTSEEGRIDATVGADEVLRLVRALHPRPGAWCSFEGARLNVIAATGRLGDTGSEDVPDPGEVRIVDGTPALGVTGGSVRLDIVRPAGKRQMTGEAWANGRRGVGGLLDPVEA